MPVKVVLGCQWGDEGKGKIVDRLAEGSEIIVRFNGGANAGHTVIAAGNQYIFHLMPTGILRPDKKCVIASGVVVDPQQLLEEITTVNDAGLSTEGRLFISGKAHIVFPYHKYLDGYYEQLRKGKALGTTGRGIGPTYADRASRSGIRMYDLLDRNRFADRLKPVLELKRKSIPGAESVEEFDFDYNLKFGVSMGESLKSYITDTSVIISDALNSGSTILFEGAQGTLLDIDYGTYPYTTSSNTIAGGLFANCGVAPFLPDEIIGVIKAYTTRVGEGPFPTELTDELGEKLREKGNEFGATTGRPRRCGWLDLVALRYAVRINGINSVALTKPDVLDGLEKIKVCTAYKYGDTVLKEFPDDQYVLPVCVPVYADFPGWSTSISGVENYENLPEEARGYFEMIEENLKAKIKYISTGPAREQTIIR